MKQLIKNGVIINATGSTHADILIENGIIAEIGSGLPAAGAEVTDASGCYIFPGFIDTHTHFDLDLGFAVTADNFQTGSEAALLGGTTTILDFATQERGQTMAQALEAWQAKASGSHCNYGFHMALTEWNDALSAEMETIVQEGVTSFKLYMVYPALRMNDGEIYCALKRAKQLGALVGAHCENFDLLNAMIAEQKELGHTGPMAHALSRPASNEAEAVNRYLRIASLIETPVYVVHLSTKEGLKEIRSARLRGQTVFVETCPQYLLLDETCYNEEDGVKYVMSPPLRSQADIAALWEGLSKNEIQMIGTDHCSFTLAQKALGVDDFTKIPNGAPGVQTRAALFFTHGVKRGHITLEQMAAQLSTNAAKLFGMYPQKGVIMPGSDADIVLWEPSYLETITHFNLAHNCDNTPYENMDAWGRARDVFINGVHVMKNCEMVRPHEGKFIKRGPSYSE